MPVHTKRLHRPEQLVYQSPKGLKKKKRKRRDLKKWNIRISATEIIIYTRKVGNNRAESRHALPTGTCLQAVLAPTPIQPQK